MAELVIFWKFPHPHVVGAIDSYFTVLSFHQLQYVVPSSFTSVHNIPVDTLRHVLSSTTTGGRPSGPQLNSGYLDGLYSPCKSSPYFVIPSIFILSGWSRQRLSLA